MLYSLHILDYLDPVNTAEISNDEEYNDGQVGKLIQVYEEDFPDLSQADIILIGCREERGSRRSRTLLNGPDMIRRQFYNSITGIQISGWRMSAISKPDPRWPTPMRHCVP